MKTISINHIISDTTRSFMAVNPGIVELHLTRAFITTTSVGKAIRIARHRAMFGRIELDAVNAGILSSKTTYHQGYDSAHVVFQNGLTFNIVTRVDPDFHRQVGDII